MRIFRQHERDAIATWQRRSAMQWTVDFGPFAQANDRSAPITRTS
jgi:hypothetical protein